MLVLSRKKDESIIINDHIRVTVVEIRGDKVRLGIDAPKDVTVHRKEVYEAIQSQLKAHEEAPRAVAPENGFQLGVAGQRLAPGPAGGHDQERAVAVRGDRLVSLDEVTGDGDRLRPVPEELRGPSARKHERVVRGRVDLVKPEVGLD